MAPPPSSVPLWCLLTGTPPYRSQRWPPPSARRPPANSGAFLSDQFHPSSAYRTSRDPPKTPPFKCSLVNMESALNPFLYPPCEIAPSAGSPYDFQTTYYLHISTYTCIHTYLYKHTHIYTLVYPYTVAYSPHLALCFRQKFILKNRPAGSPPPPVPSPASLASRRPASGPPSPPLCRGSVQKLVSF
jgi:hypothetical protein